MKMYTKSSDRKKHSKGDKSLKNSGNSCTKATFIRHDTVTKTLGDSFDFHMM